MPNSTSTPADLLRIADRTFTSRLLTGTGKFSSLKLMREALLASGSELVTVALKRVDLRRETQVTQAVESTKITDYLDHAQFHLLPNTSGVRTAEEAVFAAKLAREALGTNWLKLEIHPDPKYLMPDPIETLRATEVLAAEGFVILPYCHADPPLCKRLEEAGAAAVMPLGAPIGSNLGVRTREFIEIIVEQASVPVIVDAGLGSPAHACEAMQLGVDAVLVNTAIAAAADPVAMAQAFQLAVEAGRLGRQARLAPVSVGGSAQASSPLTAFLD